MEKKLFKFGNTSLNRLKGLDENLLDIVHYALSISKVDMTIPYLGGLRTKEEQKELVKNKASKSLNSLHLLGKAVDINPFANGKIVREAKTKEEIEMWFQIVRAMSKSAQKNNTALRWGCRWFDPETQRIKYDIRNIKENTDINNLIRGNRFMDWAHYELINLG